MTVAEALQLMFEFGLLMIAILTFNDRKKQNSKTATYLTLHGLI